MLLVKTLRSSTFRLALLCIAIFGLILFAFLFYILDLSTNFGIAQSDAALSADLQILRETYEELGQEGLTAKISRTANDPKRAKGSFYSQMQAIAPSPELWSNGRCPCLADLKGLANSSLSQTPRQRAYSGRNGRCWPAGAICSPRAKSRI